MTLANIVHPGDLPPLTQRQERRALASHQTRTSIDSWNFATTIHSSTISPLHPLHSIARHLQDGGVFEMELDHQRGRRDGSSPNASRSHSRAVSFVERYVEDPSEALPVEDDPDMAPSSSVSDSNPTPGTSPALSTPPSSEPENEKVEHFKSSSSPLASIHKPTTSPAIPMHVPPPPMPKGQSPLSVTPNSVTKKPSVWRKLKDRTIGRTRGAEHEHI